MSEKIAVVTGANSGIGKVTAKALLSDGYRVVMVCRNREKAEKARAQITQETGSSRADIVLCNLERMEEVNAAAETIRQKYSRLDRLVNNAGILMGRRRTVTEEGLEQTFAVNHMAYFLMTRELMPLLQKTPKSRVINVASDAHQAGKFNPENLQLEKGYGALKAYGNSKLYNIMFTWQLAKELAGTDVTTYSLHPGAVKTNFAMESDSWFARLVKLSRLFFISPEKGARTTLYLCREPGIEHLSGRYFRNSKVRKPAVKAAHDDEACRKLWEMSEELVG